MNPIRVAAAALNQTPLDWEGNEKRLSESLRLARKEKVSILCLPELGITGYGCEDAFHAAGTHRIAWQILQRLLPLTKGLVTCFGLPVMYQNALFNTVALVVDGRIAGLVAKQHLAGDGIHYEPRWFKAWPAGVRKILEREEGKYPFGDILFNVGGLKLGFEICEDAWVAARPGSLLALQGVDVILNPSASHFAFDKIRIRERFVIEGSRAFNVSYIYSNLLGNESGRAIYDGGALIASGGKLLTQGPRFSFRDVVLTPAVIDVEATRMNQARTASHQPQIQTGQPEPVDVPFAWGTITQAIRSESIPPAWEHSSCLKEEEFTRAVALGLFDYMRKSRSQGCIVSLSGGADSAAVAALVALMLRLADQEIGTEGWKEKLAYLTNLPEDVDTLTQRLLVCVYQASANSSTTTRHAAETMAKALHAEFLAFEIEPLVQGYIAMVENALGRKLSWNTDDIALQNIQARVRSPGVWMVANLRNALLLATSNRSEAAVGYATMDGDTSGGLSPIAGIDKAFLRQWLRWLEAEGPQGLGPIPSLKEVNIQAPTAELRPEESHQTDEDDLMPYPLLDAIEKAAIRDKKTPVEVYQLMRVAFPQEEFRQLGVWVARFFRLWCRNQWKRERYAPSFHLDDENLDPKTWCRFPILSGGYELELRELETLLAKEAT